MAMHLKDPGNFELRHLALENWHKSLELNPNQPKIRNLVNKYRLSTEAHAILMDAP